MSYALNGKAGKRDDGESETFIASTLKSQRGKGGGGIGPEETLIAGTLKSQSGPGWSHDAEATYIAAPLSHGSNPNSNAAGRRREDDENLVAYTEGRSESSGLEGAAAQQTFGTAPSPIAGPLGGGNDGIGRRSEDDPNLVAYALCKDPGGTGQGHNTNYVAFDTYNQTTSEQAQTLRDPNGTFGDALPAVAHDASVRRLTPTECERLQALPDGWTQLGDTADSKRYAALGDAVTASVAEWIGRRLAIEERSSRSAC